MRAVGAIGAISSIERNPGWAGAGLCRGSAFVKWSTSAARHLFRAARRLPALSGLFSFIRIAAALLSAAFDGAAPSAGRNRRGILFSFAVRSDYQRGRKLIDFKDTEMKNMQLARPRTVYLIISSEWLAEYFPFTGQLADFPFSRFFKTDSSSVVVPKGVDK